MVCYIINAAPTSPPIDRETPPTLNLDISAPRAGFLPDLTQCTGGFAMDPADLRSRASVNTRNPERQTECGRSSQDRDAKPGCKRVSAQVEKIVRTGLASGKGMLAISKELRIGSSTVQRIKREMISDRAVQL